MIVKVQKWGNSLALRIPRFFTSEAGLKPGSQVDLSFKDGRIIVSPLASEYSLEELLSQVNKANIHEEISAAPVGRELW